MRRKIGQQGEVAIFEIDALPEGLEPANIEQDAQGRAIVSHSESGHHHIITGGGDVQVLESPAGEGHGGMHVLYAILENPAKLEQSAGSPHESFDLTKKFYEFRLSREYDPFADQVRRVMD